MSAILDALLKLAGGEKLPSSDFHSRTAIAPQDRAISFTASARAQSVSGSLPRTTSGKIARTPVERKPSSRASVPPSIVEAPQASSDDHDQQEDDHAKSTSAVVGYSLQDASSQTSTPVKPPGSSAENAITSPSSTYVVSADTSMTNETSFYTATEQSSPDQIDLGPQSLPFVLQRRALAGVSGDSQTPSRPPPAELPPVVRKPIKIEAPIRSESRKPSTAVEVNDKMDVDIPASPAVHEDRDLTRTRVAEAIVRKPKMSRWREDQIARRPFPRVINMTPRNIPILHGPPSLPYARNPSGVDAPYLDDKEYLKYISPPEEDPVALINVPYFSPAPKKVVVIRQPVQPPTDKNIVGFKNEGHTERTAQKDRPTLPPSSILRAQIRNKLAGEHGRRDYMYSNQGEGYSVKTEDVSGDDDDQLSESLFKLTTEPKEGIYAPPAKQGAKRPRSNTASSKADTVDNWRARDPQPDATAPVPVMTIDELMARFHNDGGSQSAVTVKPPAPSEAELKKIDENVTPSKSSNATPSDNGTPKLKASSRPANPKPRLLVSQDETHKDNEENDPDSSDKMITKAKGTPNAGRLLKRQRVSSRSSLSKTSPPRT